MCRISAALAIVLSFSGVGCGYLKNRAADFADIFRVEASIGVGLQAHVNATDLAHVGLGSSRRYTAGYRYGEFVSERRIEDDLPLSYLATLSDPAAESLHSLRWGPSNEGAAQHRCYDIIAGELNHDTWEKDPIHYWDIEVSAMAGIVGLEIGFSLGEFFDFLAGIFTFDPAHDDGYANRRAKQYWHRIKANPVAPIVNP